LTGPQSTHRETSPSLLQCEELVAQIDEGRTAALAPKLEVEQSTVKSQSLFDVTNFERYVVETNGVRLFCFSHATLHQPIKAAILVRLWHQANMFNASRDVGF
jgi:hypothetical protein